MSNDDDLVGSVVIKILRMREQNLRVNAVGMIVSVYL